MQDTEQVKADKATVQALMHRAEELTHLLQRATGMPGEEARAILKVALHKADELADDLGLFVGGVEDRHLV